MIIDLTHSLQEGMPVFPGMPEPRFRQAHSLVSDGFAEMSISLGTHTGTHIDAPSHVIAGARSLSDFAVAHFVGSAALIDVIGMSEISLAYLKGFGSIIDNADFVLLRSGWQHKWSSAEYLRGFPVLSSDASAWLAAQNLNAVGIDAISIDAVDDTRLVNHHNLLSQDTLIIENLTNLDRIHDDVVEFHCLPLNIRHADGAPVRAYCHTPD